MTVVDDFVMLGKTVPEEHTGDGRVFVCTAGYSPELRMAMRIYPMAWSGCPARWSISRIPLERNPEDSRAESWKIKGDRSPSAHAAINRVIEPQYQRTHPRQQRDILQAMRVDSIRQANAERRSLCVLFPASVPSLSFEKSDGAHMAPTPDMFGFARTDQRAATRFQYHPRLQFSDEDGDHDLMLRDWGCYEFLRKNPGRNPELEEALNLTTAPPLLCGNFNRHRNAWLIISVFSGAIHARPEIIEQADLFSLGAP
jgi:hypothetical protein